MLGDTSARQNVFRSLAQADSNDHEAISIVKARINKLIDEEVALAGFKDQLSEEERSGLADRTYDDVATHSNFYFSMDANKKDRNLKIYNVNAPGNKFRHPNVILPHENVHVQRYINTEDLNEEKLFEIYGYYSLMIDMHIA